MEVRVVRFNIKQFIEDYIFCIESEDIECKEQLEIKFDRVFFESNSTVKVGIITYLINSAIAKEYPEIQDIITKYISFL